MLMYRSFCKGMNYCGSLVLRMDAQVAAKQMMSVYLSVWVCKGVMRHVRGCRSAISNVLCGQLLLTLDLFAGSCSAASCC